VRGVCGCPVAGLTPHELLTHSRVVEEFTDIIVATASSQKCRATLNVTITGLHENWLPHPNAGTSRWCRV